MSDVASYMDFFQKAEGYYDVNKKRLYETRDIVVRTKFLSRENIVLKDYTVKEPVSIFNPALFLESNSIHIYARIIIGYYLYISSIAEIVIDINELFGKGLFLDKKYDAIIKIVPDNKYDINGTEDPRIYTIDNKLLMTYCGRSINYYYRRYGGLQFTAPITAYAYRGNNQYTWTKKEVYYLAGDLKGYVIEDRDAFIVKSNDEYYLFHRPTMIDEKKLLVISKIPNYNKGNEYEGIRIVKVYDPVEILPPAKFEVKIGWAMPPLMIKDGLFIAFIHGVDREIEAYRLYATLLKISKNEIAVEAVTPTYIMEPKLFPEIVGDRPYTLFPTGLWKLSKDEYLIAYGAADHSVGIGVFNINELYELLDAGKIY
ncbi:MAG: glycosidase [Staphylothermus sp.]|nr:glycosidase [Staphylothermus sp.]